MRTDRALAVAVLVSAELAHFRAKRSDPAEAWRALERAHILSQLHLPQHLRVHVAMLGFAVSRGDAREIVGQFVRLLLAPLGEIAGRIPIGNTGRSNVSAFVPMPVPADIREQIERLP